MSPLRAFQGCRDRIGWAYTRRKEFAAIWEEFIENEPYSPILDIEDNGTGRLLISQNFSIPDRLSLILGEIFYHLRAALDAGVYASAVQRSGQNPPPGEKYLEFPICDSFIQFEKATRKISPLSDYQRLIIESVQPYNTPDNIPSDMIVRNVNRTLGILNDWARKDRHRNLRVVGSWASSANPMLQLPIGCSLAYMLITNDGFFEYEHVIAEFKIDGFRPGMEIEANPNLAIDVSVNEPPMPCSDNDTLDRRINTMFLSVKTIINALEKSFDDIS